MKKSIILVLLFLLIFASCAKKKSEIESKKSEKIRIILDSDANNELDDQHAIAYLLFNGHVFDVEGITVNKTYNGGSIEKHFEEAKRVVRLCSLDAYVNVYKGATGQYSDIIKNIKKPEFDGSAAVNFIIERAHAKDQRKLVLLGIGKLTNIALALYKDPSIVDKVRVVWLGSNYPDPGEYNLVNDTTAINPLLESNVDFEMVMVRYGKPSGTDAVVAYLKDFQQRMPGKGPHISAPVIGRHGGKFTCFGDYSVNLFENFPEHPSSRPLFDMAAVAVVKNPAWADRVVISAPKFVNGKWVNRPNNSRKIIIWENFDKKNIMEDFYRTMEHFVLAKPGYIN